MYGYTLLKAQVRVLMFKLICSYINTTLEAMQYRTVPSNAIWSYRTSLFLSSIQFFPPYYKHHHFDQSKQIMHKNASDQASGIIIRTGR
jgi:hypothetical protein